MADPVATEVYDSYWRFAARRQALYERRLRQADGPWTDDPILDTYRFTNAYRAADRVSQYLIREVQYGEGRSQAPAEIVFRTLLFKLFNRIETWELIERSLGRISWQSADLAAIDALLHHALARGSRLYSAAYIMPSPAFGHARKHSNHLALLDRMMRDGLPGTIASARSLADVYAAILAYPGLGPFLAFQYAIDLNYSTLTDFPEQEFVVAGPGARDGIAKCFGTAVGMSPEAVIHRATERQEEEFARRGLAFGGLFGRRLQPIDCQNLFCEVSKYARVAHPGIPGISGRTRIKQGFRPAQARLMRPFFPPKWALDVPVDIDAGEVAPQQGVLF